MADPSPFPLGSLTQKALRANETSRAWMASGDSRAVDKAAEQAADAYDAAASPDQILALASALQTFRAWLVTMRDDLNLLEKKGLADRDRAQWAIAAGGIVVLEDAIFQFDRAVSLDPEGRLP